MKEDEQEKLEMRRSISMPSQPKYLETKKLKRSEERESVYEEDADSEIE